MMSSLLSSLPPAVYCTCLLTTHCLYSDIDTNPCPQFYVNVTDIDMLQNLDSYVACTTEKIFQSKTHLYDVFVDDDDFQYSSEGLNYLTRPSVMDEARYVHLNNVRSVCVRVCGQQQPQQMHSVDEPASVAREDRPITSL